MSDFFSDKDWVDADEDFFQFKAFDWRSVSLLRTSQHFFLVSIRKKANKSRLKPLLRGDLVRSKPYNVLVIGAVSGIALTKEEWLEAGDPWKANANPYIDGFYVGRKYKFDFEYDEGVIPSEGGTNSGLVHHFDSLDEANKFSEKWKNKILNDHKEEIQKHDYR